MKGCIIIIFVILIACILLVTSGALSVSAAKIEGDDKIPLDAPWFKPVFDGQRDDGYSEEYTVQNKLQSHLIHEGGSRLSTAWYGTRCISTFGFLTVRHRRRPVVCTIRSITFGSFCISERKLTIQSNGPGTMR